MPEWWKRLWGKQEPPQVPPPDESEQREVDKLQTGLKVRVQREATLVNELRRIGVEMRKGRRNVR